MHEFSDGKYHVQNVLTAHTSVHVSWTCRLQWSLHALFKITLSITMITLEVNDSLSLASFTSISLSFS